MHFVPPCCPRADCPAARPLSTYRFRRRGIFRRACDGRCVQRFLCLTCRRGFSVQTFRVDYRWRKPELDPLLLDDFVSKVTLRQSARTLRVTRRTVERRLVRFGEHARLFHEARLEGKTIGGVFQLDEAESFERDRRKKPLTLPVLIERSSRFLVHVEVAFLPARKASKPEHQSGARRVEPTSPVRRSGSRSAVKRCFEALERRSKPGTRVLVQTDRKVTYPTILKDVFGKRVVHERTHSKRKRDWKNPLFAINHTLAMMRDGLSRLVRRTWAHAKQKERLELALWIYLVWRNYVRGITNVRKKESPAMCAGIESEMWTNQGVLGWSARFPTLLVAQ